MSRAGGGRIAWIALIAVETLCQIAVKRTGEWTGPLAELRVRTLLAAVQSPWLWVALGCYVAGFFVWMKILSRSTLSAAFPASAIVFVAAMFASVFVFGETVGALQIAGCAAIVAGIVLLGADPAVPESEPHSEAASPHPSPVRSPS